MSVPNFGGGTTEVTSDDVPSLVDSHPSLGSVLTWNMFCELAELVVDVSVDGLFCYASE